MERPIITELFVLMSLVDDYRGRGAAVIQWVYPTRRTPPVPYPDLIADYHGLPTTLRRRAEIAARALLTRPEAIALHTYLEHTHPAWAVRCRFGGFEVPLKGQQAAALLAYAPGSEGPSFWTIGLPAVAGVEPPPIPAVGLVAQWTWPELMPEEVSGLEALRERLGLSPIPAPGPDAHAR